MHFERNRSFLTYFVWLYETNENIELQRWPEPNFPFSTFPPACVSLLLGLNCRSYILELFDICNFFHRNYAFFGNYSLLRSEGQAVKPVQHVNVFNDGMTLNARKSFAMYTPKILGLFGESVCVCAICWIYSRHYVHFHCNVFYLLQYRHFHEMNIFECMRVCVCVVWSRSRYQISLKTIHIFLNVRLIFFFGEGVVVKPTLVCIE